MLFAIPQPFLRDKFYTIVIESFYEKNVHKQFIFCCTYLLKLWRKTTLAIVDEIFHTLQNGKWHDLEEVSEKTQLSVFKLELLTNFLAEYEFIELDRKKQRTRLTPSLLNFIREIQDDDA
jgi:hypothetical protein